MGSTTWKAVAVVGFAALATGCNGFTGASDLGVGSNGSAVVDAPRTPAPQLLSCSYPVGDVYGPDEGQELAASIGWGVALPANEDTPRPVSLSEFFDCDGSKGIHAVMFLTSKFFCPACDEESSQLEAEIEDWRAQRLGIEVAELLLNDPNTDNSAPTLDGVQTWRDQWGLESATIAADPGFSLVVGGTVGTPQITIVDPRTMKVVMRQEGWSGPGEYQTLIDLAQQNKAAAGL